MNIYRNPIKSTWQDLLERPVFDTTDLYGLVEEIIMDVKEHGDKAVIKYTSQFDHVDVQELKVSESTLSQAGDMLSDDLRDAINRAKRNIQKFHSGQLTEDSSAIETEKGVKCWQKTVPIQKVGLYIPGGSAPLLSTVLMLGIPAVLAGCSEIVLCTPPGEDGEINPAILYIANLLGIKSVFAVGGVQAIAAMAYGTESVSKVNKIFGPGNQYVTAAKQLVSRDSVAIDFPAGPSELAVMADESAVPAFVASDLLSQAEHGSDSQVLLITDAEDLIHSVQEELILQLEQLPRKEIAQKALSNSKIILLSSKEEMVELVNEYAPEHLIIACENYDVLSAKIVNAGSVFLGNYTPESAGDYASGTNHTLPTNGWAHAYSGLNMDAFVKKITFQEISREGLHQIGKTVMTMAEAEELQAHSNAVQLRVRKI